MAGGEVGVLFNGVEPGSTKVSLRSAPGFNSVEFLKPYGGGGHAAAAGATINRPLEAVEGEIITALKQLLGVQA
jgi:phosphoesterase RecJ-like protein